MFKLRQNFIFSFLLLFFFALIIIPIKNNARAVDIANPIGGICEKSDDCTSRSCCCCELDASGECVDNTKGICGNPECSNIVCPFSKWLDLKDFVKSITDFVFHFGIILAPLMFIIGGAVFFASGGDGTKITLGKNIMKWAAIGLFVILLSWGIQSIIKNILVGANP